MELLTDGLNLTEWGRKQSQRELILEGLRNNKSPACGLFVESKTNL